MLANIRIIVIDDYDLVRAGIKLILSKVHGIEVVGDTGSATEGLNLITQLNPDLVLMDLQLPDKDGLQAIHSFLEAKPTLKILVVTVCLDQLLLPVLFKIGISGFFCKKNSAPELIRAVTAVAQGQTYVSPGFIQKLGTKKKDLHKLSLFDMLSERELQVVLMIIDGQSIQIISETLGINRKTINSYRSRSFQKLNIENDVELTLLAFRQGLLKPPHFS